MKVGFKIKYNGLEGRILATRIRYDTTYFDIEYYTELGKKVARNIKTCDIDV